MSLETVYVLFNKPGDYLPKAVMLSHVVPSKPEGWEEMGLDEYTTREHSAEGELFRKWAVIRAKRDLLLADSDKWVLPDSPKDVGVWVTYRAVLRALPQTFEADPDSVVWPEAP